MENLWTVILAVLGAYLAVVLAIAVLTVIAWWRLFSKAGQAGWKSVVPVLNVYTLYKICWKPVYFWLALLSSAAAPPYAAYSSTLNSRRRRLPLRRWR